MAAAEEMDFGSMKRKELQALCKKHGIPANKTNREMTLLLTLALKVNESTATRSPDEGEDSDEENETGGSRKRVRFSPEVETREYEPTAHKQNGRVTRANAKTKKTDPGVVVDEPFSNSEKDGLSEGSRKLVKERAEVGKVGRRGKRNAAKGKDSEPMLVMESREVGGRITRRGARSQSTGNTSAVNQEEDHCEVIVVGESPVGAKRCRSRRQCAVTQTSKHCSEGELVTGMDAQAKNGKVDETERHSVSAGNLKRTRRKTASNNELGANTDAEASKEGDIEKASAPVANSRRSRRKTVVVGTVNPVDEVGDDESVVVGEEIPKHVKRISTRQKSSILQESKSKDAEEKLRGKGSKVGSNSKLEATMVDEASVVDNLPKVSGPVGNLRRSRRQTKLDDVPKAEALQVEESAMAVDRNGSDAKELKRKVDMLEVEPSETSKEKVKVQKAPSPTGKLRRSRRKTVVPSPTNAETVGSLRQIDELVSRNDVQPVDESRHRSIETGKTTDAVGEIERQGRKGKRARVAAQVVKREESVVGRPRQSARVNSKSSKAETAAKEQHNTIKLQVAAMEANKSAEDIVPVEESPMEVVEIDQLESIPEEASVDTGGKMEGTPSAPFSNPASSSTDQGLPSASAVSEKTHAEVTEERNAAVASVLSEEKLELLHSSGEGVCLVSPEGNKSSERTENLNEISGELSFKLVGASMDEETAMSSRKPSSMSQEANHSADDCDEWVQEFATEDDKDEQLNRSLEMSEELNHGNLGQSEQPKSEARASDVDDLSTENQLPLVDIEASGVQPESTIFTEWELNLIRGSGNQEEVIGINKQTIKDELICNDAATLMAENSAISEEAEVQVAQMELDANDGVSMKWEENKSPIIQTVASRKDETFDLLNTYDSGLDMVSPKAAAVSVGVAEPSATNEGTLDVHEQGAGGAPEVFGGAATVEDRSERRYSTPRMATHGSSSRQNIQASPKETETMGFNLLFEGQDEEVAEKQDCPLTIGEEVEGLGKEDNPPGSSSYGYEQFLENQGSTLPVEDLTTDGARQLTMENAVDGLFEHLSKEEAEECPEGTMSDDSSSCKDAAVNNTGGSDANFVRVLCQESAAAVGESMQLMADGSIDTKELNQGKSLSEMEENPSGQKESTEVAAANEEEHSLGLTQELAKEETETLENSSGLPAIRASSVHKEEETESTALNLLFEGHDGEANQVTTSISSPAIALVGAQNDDVSISSSSPFCIPLRNSFEPLYLDMSPVGGATMEVDKLRPSPLSTPPQKAGSDHRVKAGAAIDDVGNHLRSPRTGGAKDGRGEEKQEKAPWCSELEMLGSPRVARTSLVPDAALGSTTVKDKLASLSSSAFLTRRKPSTVIQRTTGKIFNVMKENAGRSKLDMLQQLGNVTGPPKSLTTAARRRPLQDLTAGRRKD